MPATSAIRRLGHEPARDLAFTPVMLLLLLEALGALLLLLLIVWWTMFSGRRRGELDLDAQDKDRDRK